MSELPEACAQARDLIPSQSVGALGPEETAQLEQHLASCPDCRQVQAEYRQVGEALLHASPRAQPPAHLRAQVMRALPARQTGADESRSARRTWPLAAAVAALVLLLVNVVLLAELANLRRVQSDLQSQVDRNQMALAVQSYPNSRVVEVEGQDVFGAFAYDPGRTASVLYAWGLPELAAGKAYQAWFVDSAGDRASGGLFASQDQDGFSIVLLWSPEPLENYLRLGVTVEPAGGSPGPTGPSVLTADLQR